MRDGLGEKKTGERGAVLLAVLIVIAGGCANNEDTIEVARPFDPRAPVPILGLAAFPGDRMIQLAWIPSPEEDVIGYHVYRSQNSTTGFQRLTSVGISQAPYHTDLGEDLDGDGVPDGLTNHIRYFYRVSPFDLGGIECALASCPTVSAVPGEPPLGLEDLVVDRVSVFGDRDALLLVTWASEPNPLLYGFKVYRSCLTDESGFLWLATVMADQRHFWDADMAPGKEYAYQVAPVTRLMHEGPSTQSRAVHTSDGDGTIPKPPGSDPRTGVVQFIAFDGAGFRIRWGRPTENLDGSVMGLDDVPDDIVGGGYIVYRGFEPKGPYEPIAILEHEREANAIDFTDPEGTTAAYYYTRAYDLSGTLSAPSAVVSTDTEIVLPTPVRRVDAFAGTEMGTIAISWDLEASATMGYRVYRSIRPDRGFEPISLILEPQTTLFVDGDPQLQLGRTYWYKVAGAVKDAIGDPVEGPLSIPAPATPGPSDGIYHLPAENARVFAYTNTDPADWSEIRRMAFPDPFFSRGVLFLDPAESAIPGISALALVWDVEIDTSPPPAPGDPPERHTYDVYLSTIHNATAGEFDVGFVSPTQHSTVWPGQLPVWPAEFPVRKTGSEFHEEHFGSPPVPRLMFMGQITFGNDDQVGTDPTPETLMLYVGYQGFHPAVARGNGELFLDEIILVRRD